jgi:hypothetical protein
MQQGGVQLISLHCGHSGLSPLKIGWELSHSTNIVQPPTTVLLHPIFLRKKQCHAPSMDLTPRPALIYMTAG